MRCGLRTGWLWLTIAVCAALPSAPFPAHAQDADNDGLTETLEEQLGTDKSNAEPVMTLRTFPATSKEHPELDVVRVDFGNVAKDRWLWVVHFAKPYTFDNSDLILYLDSDNNPKTGRTDMGCEVMLAHNRGAPGVTGFAPNGTNIVAASPRVALDNGVLYLCHDGEIKQENGRSVFRFTVLSETREPHASVDSTGWVQATGPPNSERKKVLMLDDVTKNENFATTEGLDLIWKLQADPANVVLSSVGAELKGMAYYDAEYRWPAVHGGSGTITVAVPKAGTFYPAIVVYDTAGREAYELQVDGKTVGRFVAAEDDNRQRLHFLGEPIAFKGGEKLTLRVGTTGRHITEDILLLAKRPPVRGRKFGISNIEVGYVKRDGQEQARVTWITTWPSACTVEYGTSTAYTEKTTEGQPVANHRLYLTGLRRGATYHFRIVAPRPDGQTVASKDATFALEPPKPFAGKATMGRVPLKVENLYDFALTAFPVSSGVPFAKGELGDAANVRLLDPAGKEVEVQPKVTARWQDGGVKWLLVSFLASLRAKAAETYTLEYETSVRRASAPTPLRQTQQGNVLTVDTGILRAQFDASQSGLPTKLWFDANGDGQFTNEESLTGEKTMGALITDVSGKRYTTNNPAVHIEVEESGPVRIVVKVTGHHASENGERLFICSNRFVFYAGLPFVRVYYTWGNDWQGGDFANFGSLSLHIPLPSQQRTWTVGLGAGRQASGQGDLTLRQLRDDSFDLTPAPAAGAKTARADGWIDLDYDGWGLTIAVRDFWQLYPKAFRVTVDGLDVDLCPGFPGGTYDACSKLDEIKLYYYLMGGKYKVRQGVQKQHELMFYFHVAQVANLRYMPGQVAQAFQEPPIAACSPERYCDTQVFGEVLPATAGRSPEYEEVCEKVHQNYVSHRDRSHEFGMLNFGDQWGERKVNWANGEYDHHHAFLMQFIRTGDRKWYFLGEKAARHAIDVDTCHYGPRQGGEWIHAMGHTGGYFTSQYEGNGIPGGGFSPSHTWTEGFCDWYLLSGDPTASENAALVADHYDGVYLNNYDWGNCRDNGWHLLLTLAAYRATDDPYYLNAARIIVERTLERQTPGGGWHRQMVPGHCYDMPRHRGEANFMLGVLANGLEEYYREVPDRRVAEAIIGGAKQAVKELWVDEANGFRYTSCPNMKGYTANNDMTAEILFFAHRLGGDPLFADIAMRAMQAAFEGGIGSIAHLRWTPHIIYNMDLLKREGVALKPKKLATVYLRKGDDRPFDLWLCRPSGDSKDATGAAELTNPKGQVFRANEGGRFHVEPGTAGLYKVRVRAGSGSWQPSIPATHWVVDATEGVTLQIGATAAAIGLRPMPGAREVVAALLSGSGSLKASLAGQEGRPVEGKATPSRWLHLRRAVTEQTHQTWTLTLKGPGEVELRLQGALPCVSLTPAAFFNPSAPVVVIEGPRALRPGESAVKLKARVSDLEDDVVRYHWQFDDGETKEGEVAEHRFATGGMHQVTLAVADKAGNQSTALVAVSIPPPELASLDPARVVLVEAEDFVDQGLDEVRVFDRIGNSGRMISYWDATVGHWLEWEVPIAIESDYVIYLRYASGGTNPHRSLTIDGRSPGPVFDDMALPPTGGFCTSEDNWRFFAAGGGKPVHLIAAKHRLRMTNLGDGVGLDYLTLVGG